MKNQKFDRNTFLTSIYVSLMRIQRFTSKMHKGYFLLTQFGFVTSSVTTPGKLDLDIMFKSKEIFLDRFWYTFLSVATELERAQWQSVIATSGWSSHMMVVCRKPQFNIQVYASYIIHLFLYINFIFLDPIKTRKNRMEPSGQITMIAISH